MDEELYQLCKEVYERTGWFEKFYIQMDDDDEPTGHRYTSDYLLEKLPITTHVFTSSIGSTAHVDVSGETFFGDGHTPLKSLLKLTIALHDAGVKL